MLAVVVAAILTVRALSANFLVHDDAITMLGVTCNQGRYAAAIPTQQWVQAAVWQDYWRLGTPGCFDVIRSDLADFDIHPTLYFWVLHLWFMVFGVSISGALVLNLLLIAATGVLIFAACRTLSVLSAVGLAVVLTWALTMSTRAAGAALRPYALLGAFSALLLLLTVLWLRHKRFRYLAAMAPVVAAGLLTQFLFAVVAGAVFAVVTLALVAERRYRVLGQLVVVYVVAGAVFVATDPHFMNSVRRGGEQAQAFSWAALPARVLAVLASVFESFLPLDPSYQIDAVSIAVCVITLVVMVPILAVALRWLWRNRLGCRRISATAESAPLLLFLGSWLTVVMLYLSFVSPQHSMRPVYLYFLTPFLFVGLAVAARRSASVVRATSVLLVFQLVGVAIATGGFVYSHHSGKTVVPGADAAIVLDSDRRGIVPPALWPVAPEVPIYAATQDQLLRQFPDLAPAASRRLYYVSKVMFGNVYGNTVAKRDLILKEFADRGYISARMGSSAAMGGAEVYQLTRRASP
ncbi:glycosyltransferase family 39 protein [Mycolicibacterium sp. J2]|uniref:glycosyltransferase family 39 protein n=1 Tax=Mycolicibacterium sp. J2 TaxID=2993511 RepID=UPI00224AE710|nr:glycosyltransferase family 39 protein [Mycolicibacterium sp. J2]MCX2713509.1 glycosyltransferase family 39 protein [Mycolicibacterium sp. J2]